MINESSYGAIHKNRENLEYPIEFENIANSNKNEIHLFKKFEKYFVLDKGSGVVTELDSLTWDIVNEICNGRTLANIKVKLAKVYTQEIVSSGINELIELYSDGHLFSEDPFTNSSSSLINPCNICLLLTSGCNLRCKYCYVFQNNTSSGYATMTNEVAKKSVDFLINNSLPNQNLSISLFGGEPLLNFHVLKNTVEYAREKAADMKCSLRFNITTNGTLLTKKIRDFLALYPEISIIFSIDGDRKIQNKFRKFKNGKGSYDQVIKAFKELQNDLRIDKSRYSFRGTFMLSYCELIKAASALNQLGINDFSIEPAITNDIDKELTKSNIQKIKNEYDKLAIYYLDCKKKSDGFDFFHFQIAMDNVSYLKPMYKPCGAGNGYIAIDSIGDIYPCHRFSGKREYILGNIYTGLINHDLIKRFARINVNSKPTCRNCWAKYHCGGGCHYHGATFYKDISKPFYLECELIKHRIELGAYLYSKLTELKPENQASNQHWIKARPEFDFEKY